MTIGLYRVRRQHQGETPIYRAWNAAVIFTGLVSVFLLITPWIPPKDGIYAGDVSFLYCTYIIVGIGELPLVTYLAGVQRVANAMSMCRVGLLFICGAYYVVWMKILPRLFNYHYEVDVSLFSYLRLVESHDRFPVPSIDHNA